MQCVINLRKGKVTQFGSVLARRQSAYTAKTVQSDSGAKHTYSEEEKIAFADHINRTLGADERLQDRLPLDVTTDALFRAVSDGILLCKLINKAVPDTVDERALNMGKTLNVYQMNENQNLVINAAKGIGCKVVNIHNEDLIGEYHFKTLKAVLSQLTNSQCYRRRKGAPRSGTRLADCAHPAPVAD